MSDSKAFEDARLLVDRAQGHIDELEVGIKGFFADEPWATIVEPNVEKTEYVYKFRPVQRFDPNLKTIAADAANNLRSALDHIASECAMLNGAENIKNIHFPFRPTAAELDKVIAGKDLRDVPSEVLAYFRALNPHKGGNDRLYALTQISARNKHWSLTPMFTNVHGIKVIHDDNRQRMVQTPHWPTSAEDDLVLFTSPNADEHYQLNILVTVRFDEINGLDKSHPVATLRYLAGVVNDVIDGCEAICQRLGLL